MSFRSRLCLGAAAFLLVPTTASAQIPGKGVDACTVVSKAEVELAIGLKLKDGVKDPTSQEAGVQSNCDYEVVNDGGMVSVLLRRDTMKYSPDVEKAELEKLHMKLNYISGLGTRAGFIDMMGMGTGLVVFYNDYNYLQVASMMTNLDAKTVSPRLEKLARLVMTRWK